MKADLFIHTAFIAVGFNQRLLISITRVNIRTPIVVKFFI